MNNKVYSSDYQDGRIKNVLFFGLVLRLLFLSLVLFFFSDAFGIYLFKDDIKYETLANQYLTSALSIIDVQAFRHIGGSGYLQVFWPWVMSIAAYIFRTVYAGRFINIVLSLIVVKIIYRLTLRISSNPKTALSVAKMYAYFPTTIIYSCFPLKDIFITLAVFYSFETMVCIQQDMRLSVTRVVTNALLLVGLYYSRGAVTEMLCIFALILFLKKSVNEHKTAQVLFLIVCMLGVGVLFANDVIQAFTKKLDDYFYSDYGRTTETTIAIVRIDSLSQIWKLPLAYGFALLNPFTLQLFSMDTGSSVWTYLMCVGNMVIYPIAIGNLLYVIKPKQNLFLWITSLFMYLCVIMLSLGISRHYFFLYPLALLNYALFKENANHSDKMIVRLATAGLLFAVFAISLYRAL